MRQWRWLATVAAEADTEATGAMPDAKGGGGGNQMTFLVDGGGGDGHCHLQMRWQLMAALATA